MTSAIRANIRNLMTQMKLRQPLMSDRHVICLMPQKIAFIRIPKAANSSIRTVLAESLQINSAGSSRPAQDAFWTETDPRIAQSLCTNTFAQAHAPDFWTFTIVRNPVARLYSCWNNKVVENKTLSASMVSAGIHSNMSFDSFVSCVARTSDRASDIHFRSQTSMLKYQQKIVPNFVGRLENIEADWDHIGHQIQSRTETSVGPLPMKNARMQAGTSLFDDLPQHTARNILFRYSDDFRHFYPVFWLKHQHLLGDQIGL